MIGECYLLNKKEKKEEEKEEEKETKEDSRWLSNNTDT